MKRTQSLFWLLLILGQLQAQQFIDTSFVHQSLTRDYIIYVPANYDSASPMPLVLNFHGYGSNAGEQIFYGDFKPIADTAGFLIVSPNGTRDATNTTHWNVGWGGSNVDDLSFTNALIDTLIAHYNVDPNRVYSTGMSNGGFMSHMLACELSNRIAAIASVTGSMTDAKLSACNPQHPMPMMQIHGTGDLVVPYAGQSPWTTAVDSVVDYWLNINQCQLPAIETDLPDINPTDGSTVRHYQYLNGTSGATVELYKVFNGGHTWPNNQYVTNGTNFDFDASLAIWQFFAQYDLNGLRNTTAIEETFIPSFSLFPNPVENQLNVLRSSEQASRYQILDLNSKVVIKGSIQNAGSISLDKLTPGIYFLEIEGVYQRFVKQ
ncbi:MAG: PHB depolymerase family esterase [Bacteroidia bacterium]